MNSFPTTTKARRLQPRTPKAHQIEEEEEVDEEDEELLNYNSGSGGGERKKLRAKESLLDMLSSEPPSSWKADKEKTSPLPTTPSTSSPSSIASKMMRSRSNSISREKENNGITTNSKSRETSPTRLRKLSLKRKVSISSSSTSTTPLITPTTSPQQQQDKSYLSSPNSTPMKSTGSNSSVQSYRSGISYDSNLSSPSGGGGQGIDSDSDILASTPSRSSRNKSIVEDLVIGSVIGSKPGGAGGGRRLEAKDEISESTSTKRANDDLVAFLNSPPPKNIPLEDPFRSDQEVMNANGMNGFSSLKKKGIRGFMSKLGAGVVGGKKEESYDNTSDGNSFSNSRASSTIIRSLGRKTSKFNTNDDSTISDQFSTNQLSSSRLNNNRSTINANTFNTTPIASSQSTPQLIIETTPPSPITNQFTTIPTSQPPGYSVPSYSRPSPLTNGNSNSNSRNNLSSPSSRAMEYSKSLESPSTTSSSTLQASDPYKIVSNDRSLAEDGLSTISKRAGPVRSLSVGSLDTGITTSTSTSVISPALTPSTPVILTTPTVINEIKPTAIIIPGGGSPRSSSSLSRNRRDSISSSIASSTTTTGGSAFNSQTNFKPVPLHILTSNIFSPVSTSTSIVNSTPNSGTVSNSTTNTITKRDIATSPNIPTLTSTPSSTSTLSIEAVAVATGIVSTASVVKLARSSSARVKVPKVEGGNSANRDGSPSPTTGTLPYLISRPDEIVSTGEEKEGAAYVGGEEEKEKEEKFPISTTATQSTELATLSPNEESTTPVKDINTVPTESHVNALEESPPSTDQDLQTILVELKKKMENASSKTECLALLDQFMKLPAKGVEIHRSRLPSGIPVLATEEISGESEMLMMEFFLGASDLNLKTVEKQVEVSDEKDMKQAVTYQKEKGEVVVEDAGEVEDEEEDEEEVEEEVELKMPGAM